MTVNVAPVTKGGASSVQMKVADFQSILQVRSPLAGDGPAPTAAYLEQFRQTATAQLDDYEFPTTRDEEWRFTNLAPMLAVDWTPSTTSAKSVTAADIEAQVLPEVGTSLVFVDGQYRADLSSMETVEGVVMGALSDAATAEAVGTDLERYLGQQQGLEQAFTTLNAASLVDGAVVWARRNAIAPQPIQIVYLSTAADTAQVTAPRCLVVAEPNSQLTLIETHACVGDNGDAAVYFTNAVTEIYVEDNASVHHIKVQQDGTAAFHISKTAVSQARSSRYRNDSVTLGGRISRHNLEVFQQGEQTETHLNGLSMVAGQQLADTHSLIAYQHPHGTSNQVQKCIIDDRAHAVFNGKVNVPQAAQLTDAGQLNRNLLLSSKARVDTKPQLEIVADNVKCTHGATVSQLKADEIFYLQSRGIDVTRAQNLLIYAFAAEILEKLPIPSLKQRLSEAVTVFTREA